MSHEATHEAERRIDNIEFNVADIAVSCGAVALALSLWREDNSRRPAVPTS